MIRKAQILFFAPLVLFSIIHLSSHSNVYFFRFTGDKNLKVGEELTYVVSYAFIDLGEVKTVVTGKDTIDGKTYYDAKAFIDSYSGIPFVDLHQIYFSTINPNYYSRHFKGIVKYDDYDSYTNYYFKYDSSKVHVVKGKVSPAEVWTDSTASIHQEFQDGLSILYYARMHSGIDTSVNLPCFVNEKEVYTEINFQKKVTGISIDAVDYDVACTELTGYTDFISVFGLTGHFEGWFSADEAAVPIEAKMNVIIGSISLELTKWKREGWNPPKIKTD